MEPAKLDRKCTRGDSYSCTFTFSDDDGAIDYSGDDIAAQVRPNYDSPDSQAQDFAIDDTDADTGIVIISLTAEQTAVLPVDCVWDFVINETTLFAGAFTVKKDVTR